MEDLSTIEKWVKNPEELMQWSGPAFQHPINHEQWKNYIEKEDQLVFTVISKNSSTLVGHIAIGRIDWCRQKGRIGKVIVSPEERGNGLGENIMKCVLNHAFRELKLREISLGVFDFNISGIRLYEKVGFKKQRLLMNHRRIGQETWNLYEMSMTSHNWVYQSRNVFD